MKEFFGKENFEQLCDLLKEVVPTKGPIGFEKVVMSELIPGTKLIEPYGIISSINVTPGNWLFFTKGYGWNNSNFIDFILYDEKYGWEDYDIPSACLSPFPIMFLKIEENTKISAIHILDRETDYYSFQIVGIKFSDVNESNNENSSESENKGIGFVNYKKFFYPKNTIVVSETTYFDAEIDCWAIADIPKKGDMNDEIISVDNEPVYSFYNSNLTDDDKTKITLLIPLKKGQRFRYKKDVFFRGCYEMMY